MSDTNILDALIALAEQGAAIVRLRPKSKRPIQDNWTQLPRLTPEELRDRFVLGENGGLRLGKPSQIRRGRYVYGIDMDIRARRYREEAWAALLEAIPGADSFPQSISGSGGESRHLLFQSDGVFRKRNIARSERTIEEDGVEKRAWEIDFFGTGAQIVLPPSIHPITGLPYRWATGETPILADLPFVRSTRLEKLFTPHTEKRERVDREPEPIRDLERYFETKCWGNSDDREIWLKMIFAVKQEYDGTDLEDKAYAALEEWSARSLKHDPAELRNIYDHARTDRPDGVTLGTIKKEALREINAELQESIAAEMKDVRHLAPPTDSNGDWCRRPNIKYNDSNQAINIPENRLQFIEHDPRMKNLVWAVGEEVPYWRKPEGSCYDMRLLTFNGKEAIPYEHGSHYQVVDTWLRGKPIGLEGAKKEQINDAIDLVVKKRPWNRLEEILTQEKWDGIERVDYLLQDYLGAEDNEYTRNVSRLLVLVPMCRVLYPGTRADFAPILQGAQGIGKDRFLANLCTFDEECLYTDSYFDMSDAAKYVHIIKGKLIVHMPEMATVKKHELEVIKSFITAPEDSARMPYARGAQTFPRTSILVGSTNHMNGILHDPTGDRRFLPVKCGAPDRGPDGVPRAYAKMFPELIHDRGQIWAEAYELALEEAERQGGKVRSLALSAEAFEIVTQVQEDQRAESREDHILAQALEALDEPVPYDDLLPKNRRTEKTAKLSAIRNQLSSRELWCDVLGKRDDDFFRNMNVVVTVLHRLPGWTRLQKNVKHHGISQRIWRRDGTDGWPTVVDDMPDARNKDIQFPDARRRKV